MNQGNLSRRGFLARSLGALTAAGLPVWHSREILAHEQAQQQPPAGGATEVVMGAIGVGTNYTRRGNGPVRGERGIAILNEARRLPGVRYIGVCDVDRHNRGFAANLVGNGCRQYEDYRELLANRDITAVTIGTPDHWHAAIAIAAMRAGKDVYCEKPMTLTVAEGQAVVRVARETNRIFQVGSQQRTEMAGRFRLACELVRNGRIGRVETIETRVGDNPRGGPFNVAQAPDGLNWDFWLGQTPRVDYIPERCFYEFRWWYEYSGGKMTDWGAHHNDIAQWALNMDNSGPSVIEGRGDNPPNDGRSYNCHRNFRVTYTYNNGPNGAAGTRLICTAAGDNGVRFNGENGRWIFVSRGALQASNQQEIITAPLPQNATRLGTGTNHMANFIQCVRSRQQPTCTATIGHRSGTVCHLGNIAVRSGLRLQWDPEQERFTGETAEAATRYLSRERRANYPLGA